jgi:hypothetical protein
MKGTIGMKEGRNKRFILYGTLARLEREGECWTVSSFGGLKTHIKGFLDVQTGELIFLWIPPGK